MSCDAVSDVPNAKRSPAESAVICGANVTYTCKDGFTLEGDSALQCLIGGKLQGQVPVCKGSGNSFLYFLKNSPLSPDRFRNKENHY